jgi:hypothetical protein
MNRFGGSLTASGPGAVSWGSGRIDVVGRVNNAVTHSWFDGTWHSGDNLGGSIQTDPISLQMVRVFCAYLQAGLTEPSGPMLT